MTNKTNLKIRKPIAFGCPNKEFVFVYENVDEAIKLEEITFSMSKIPANKVALIYHNKDGREEIRNIRIQ